MPDFGFGNKRGGDARRVTDLVDVLFYKNYRYFINEHPRRVAILSAEIGRAKGYSEQYVRDLAVIALLHDVGKVHDDCRHLFCSGFLTYDEKMRALVTEIHQKKGPEVLAQMRLGPYERLRKKAEETCSHHHDRADVRPRFSNQTYITAVADAWDALTSNFHDEIKERGYRKPKNNQDAKQIMLEEMVAGRFEPHATVALLNGVMGLSIPSFAFPQRLRKVKG